MRDVLHLWLLAAQLGYVDMHNVFLLGVSRGGMMTYLALKHQMPVNAAAVIGGPTDLIAQSRERPALMTQIFKQLIPDFETDAEVRLRERSAIYWPEQITVPVLIMHGGMDWRVEPRSQALALAHRLHEQHKTYELVIYTQDDHDLSLNRVDSERRSVEWFKRHMK